MNPTAMDSSDGESTGDFSEDEFDEAFDWIFGHLHGRLTRCVLKGRVGARLRENFRMLSAEGSDDGLPSGEYIACLRCSELEVTPCDMGEPVVIVESAQHYNVLRSIETAGHSFMRESSYQRAHDCYKLASAYYADRFDRYFVKSRLLKKMVAKALLEWGQYEAVLAELKEDIGQDSYGTVLDAEATLYIKYAYGRALLSKDEFSEAASCLLQPYLGQMDLEDEDNMGVLRATLQLVLDQASRNDVQFAMEAALGLLEIFQARLRRDECPVEVFEFVIGLCGQLVVGDREGELRRLSSLTSTFKSEGPGDSDAAFLLTVIRCCSPDDRQEALREVNRRHVLLLSRDTDGVTSRRLKVTSMLMSIWGKVDVDDIPTGGLELPGPTADPLPSYSECFGKKAAKADVLEAAAVDQFREIPQEEEDKRTSSNESTDEN